MATDDYQPPSANDADENGNEVPPAEAPPQPNPNLMNIRFANQHGNELHFKMKPTTKLGKAMNLFAERIGQPRQQLRFLFEGERVIDDSTPTTVDLQDGDTIEVHEEQIGGGVGTS